MAVVTMGRGRRPGRSRRRLLATLLPAAWLLAAGGIARPAAAQTPPDTTAAPDLEWLLEEAGDDAGGAVDLVERLTALAEQPLDINTASAEELAQIPWLGPVLARRIVTYRDSAGAFPSIPALRRIEGVTEDVFMRSRPYLTIGTSPAVAAPRPPRFAPVPSVRTVLRGLRFDAIQRLTRRLDLGRGYDADTSATRYLGSPERLYTRLRARYGRQVSLNLTLEKDPGEALAWDPARGAYGFDHVTLHAALHDVGRLRRLILGDFGAEFGQGLILWSGYAFGKGREPVRPLVRRGAGLRPYGSTDEARFFRGGAATVALTPALALSGFVSRRRLDASLYSHDSTSATPLVRSLPADGLHRTPLERSRRHVLGAALYGGALSVSHRGTEVGLVGYHTRFEYPLAPDAEAYRRYDFRGRRASLVSLYGQTTQRDFVLFGEVARGPEAVWAALGGLELYLRGRAEALVLARVYPEDFNSFYGAAFGERNGVTRNESGFYTGLAVRLSRRWRVGAYVDQYRFPWLRFGTPRPTSGHDALGLVEYDPRPWLSLTVQGRTETREEGHRYRDAAGRWLAGVRPETRQSLRVEGQYRFSRALELRARVEGARFAAPGTRTAHGLLLFQDLRWQARPWLRVDARLAVFDVDAFEARIYAYERDLLYTFSVPAFDGQGERGYLLLHLEPRPGFLLQIKYAGTRYEHATTVGSGLDEVPGNRLREVRVQARVRF